MQRAVEGSCRATYPLHCRADLVVGYLHPPRKPGAQRKNAFPNGWEIYGTRTMAIRRSRQCLRVTLSFPSLSSIPMYLVFFPFTRAGPNNFYSLFGRTRCTIRRDVSILERTAPDWRPEANSQGSLSVIISDESSEMNAFDERGFHLNRCFTTRATLSAWYFHCGTGDALKTLCSRKSTPYCIRFFYAILKMFIYRSFRCTMR